MLISGINLQELLGVAISGPFPAEHEANLGAAGQGTVKSQGRGLEQKRDRITQNQVWRRKDPIRICAVGPIFPVTQNILSHRSTFRIKK